MRQLTFTIWRETVMRDVPRMVLMGARDNPDANAASHLGVEWWSFVLRGRRRIMHGSRTKCRSSTENSVRRPRYEDTKKEVRRQSRRHFQFIDRVKLPCKANRAVCCKELLDYCSALEEPIVPLTI